MATLALGTLTRLVPQELVTRVLAEQQRANKNQCKLPAVFLVYYVIALGLQRAMPTREVLRWLLQGLAAWWGKAALPATVAGKAAISMARTRLGWPVLRDVFRACARPLATPATRGAWYHDYRLVALDGSSLEVLDTPENVTAFGRPSSRVGAQASVYPLVRLVTLVEVGTHAIFGAALGPWTTGEGALTDTLVPRLQPGMLVLGDRYTCSYARWQAVLATGAEILWRVKTNLTLPCERRLEDGSYLSTIYPSPKARDRRQGGVQVRVIEYALPGVPHADPAYRLLTSLLDPALAPAEELAPLYHERWDHEGLLDELKTHLRGGDRQPLRSKTPDLVRQEVYGLLLAHYAVRAVMHEAALVADEDPDALSFVHTVRVLRRALPQGAALPPSPVVALVCGGSG